MLLPNIFPVTCHTNHVGPGSTFVAIKGFRDNGTKYIKQALEKGASTIVAQNDLYQEEIESLCKKYNATFVCVPDTRIALAQLASQSLGHPCQKLKIIGITGTKGKTTTTYLVEHILRQAGYKTALLSTIVNKIIDESENSVNTTPESDYLHMFFAHCLKQGVDFVVMEVSSHALSLHRVHGVMFDGIGFTNLAPEHMDFYQTMDEYFAAKTQLFLQVKPEGTFVINSDGLWGKKALQIVLEQTKDLATRIISFGQKSDTINNCHHAPFSLVQTGFDGIKYSLQTQHPMYISCPSLFGIFNCYNLSMASLLCSAQELCPNTIIKAIATFPGVPGRLQRHTLQNGAHAFVDYAHNPSSFQEVLSTLRPHTTDLIIVFGCGGEKDKTKRPVMGRMAGFFGDTVIITDDNPRFEDRHTIINEIVSGIPQEHHKKVILEPDRRKAIALAAAQAKKDSIIALLGKGHETYYSIVGHQFHLDDFEEIRNF